MSGRTNCSHGGPFASAPYGRAAAFLPRLAIILLAALVLGACAGSSSSIGASSSLAYADSSGDIRGPELPVRPGPLTGDRGHDRSSQYDYQVGDRVLWPRLRVSGGARVSGGTASGAAPQGPVMHYPAPSGGRVGNQMGLPPSTAVPRFSPWAGDSPAANRSASTASGGQFLPGGSPASTGVRAAPPALLPYTVRPGDTLAGIARAFGVSVITVASANAIGDPNLIRVGERLLIPSRDGLFHRVVSGETVSSIAQVYGVSVAAVAEANQLRDPARIYPGQLLFIPGIPAVARGSGLPGLGEEQGSEGGSPGGYAWPVLGRITSYYGWRHGELHTGIDIAAGTGTPVRAARDGVVVHAGWMTGYGYTVIIRHDDQSATLYAHASRVLVKKGDRVTQGQVVARVGMTGNATGPHLHFEILVNDRSRDPLKYLPPR